MWRAHVEPHRNDLIAAISAYGEVAGVRSGAQPCRINPYLERRHARIDSTWRHGETVHIGLSVACQQAATTVANLEEEHRRLVWLEHAGVQSQRPDMELGSDRHAGDAGQDTAARRARARADRLCRRQNR